MYRFSEINFWKIIVRGVEMERIAEPIVYDLDYINEMDTQYRLVDKTDERLIFKYPTIYIVHHKNENIHSVYIGETSDIRQRTQQHLSVDSKTREDWKVFFEEKDVKMFVIGHELFNKSLTLDIENKLIHYMSSVDAVKKVNNRRFNQQNEYFTSDNMEAIFSKIWNKLRGFNKDIFPTQKRIEDAAIFKASPFHKLTEEQTRAKDNIMLRIINNIVNEKSKAKTQTNKEKDKTETIDNSDKNKGQLIMVNGEAGSGKTVLMSNLFFELFQASNIEEEAPLIRGIKSYLLVNHDQQLKVYNDIANKLGINKNGEESYVQKPTSFINKHSPENPVDVVIVDEAHLLLTQGKQSYRGKNQLEDLLERAKLVVIVFDENQILSTEQVWESENLDYIKHICNLNKNYIELKNQMRIHSGEETVNWIRNIIDNNKIYNIPKDSKGYDLRIFNSLYEMEEEIRRKNSDENMGLSRMVATYDWEYSQKHSPEEGVWQVTVDDWSMPWNFEYLKKLDRKTKRGINAKLLAWAEHPETINEVGSTFSVQGFDLNYVGVIIGPSVGFKDGKVIFKPENSRNKKAVQNRTLSNGNKQSFGEELLKNELNVLLTRGVKGLYIYAVDPDLQKELLRRQGVKYSGQ